jgi:HK97 family phage major capsid protein
MALRDPREVERAVDELRVQMQSVMADDTRPEQDRRDAVMRMTGEVSALEVQARELREFELSQAKAAIEGGKALGGESVSAKHVEAFNAFVRSGDINNAALLTTPDANGGFLVPDPLREAIIDVVRAQNPIVGEATVFNLTKPGTFKVELPRKTAATAGGWVAETAARPATNAPTIGQQVLEAFEWYANPEATQSFLDAVPGAEQFLVDDIAGSFSENFGIALASGDGNGKPSGLFAATSFYETKLSSTADSVDAAQIIGTYFDLPSQFLPNAVWMMKGSTLAALSALAWPNMADTPLVRYDNGTPTIMGKRVVLADNAPAIGNGNFPVAFGDIRSGYAVGIHSNLTVLRDPYSNKPYVSFYSTGRAGGVPWNPKAIVLAKSDNA